ncbi:hypothetical protein M3Y94_00137800 [Aphelenchoides besseyi]|nr:hypothetical protein M3Y94_00137800 [Aphelenchoides besseyi]KAI6237277.1 hypothetical protein M3Y95_00248200 [Aphelenchoides besseyi]
MRIPNLTRMGNEDWAQQPLSFDDLIAAGVLLIVGLVSITFYGVVAYVMKKNDKDIVGFRFLFSAAIADIFLLFNYSIWPALTILFKSEIISKWMRHWVQMYLDLMWFSMCYHYLLIAWSRFAAIKFASSFRTLSKRFSYGLCVLVYIIAFIQVLATHFQPWYVVFYFEPSEYGMLCEDFPKYLNEGQSLFFATFHFIMIVIPAAFYIWALIVLYEYNKRRSGNLFHKTSTAGNGAKAKTTRTEIRLMVPCALNTLVFIVGQVVITIGTGSGKWSTLSVLLLFTANSAVNPFLFFVFSSVIREKVLAIFNPKSILHRPTNISKQSNQITITTSTVYKRDSPSVQLAVDYSREAVITTPEVYAVLGEVKIDSDPRLQTYV